MGFCASCGLIYPEGHAFCPLDGMKLVEREDELLGRVLSGQYRIVSLIGEGGMGRVYLARNVHRDQQVAVKVLPVDVAKKGNVKRRFLREARAANMVKHEHVVEVYDLGETEEGMVYMTMEYLEGQTLRDVMKQGPLPLERAVHILRQILEALGPTHAMGIIHRDLKPENVFLVSRSGDTDFVKLLDFGIAHLVFEPGFTKKGFIVGTPQYMSPEMIKGKKPGPWSDLYSVGCIAYVMSTGQEPQEAKSLEKLLVERITKGVGSLDEARPDMPEAFRAIVRKLLESEPLSRYPDAYAVKRDLDAFMPATEAERVIKTRVGQVERMEVKSDRFDSGLLGSWKDLMSRSDQVTGPKAETLYQMKELTGQLESLSGMMERVDTIIEALEHDRRDTSHRIQKAIEELAIDASGKLTLIQERRLTQRKLDSEMALLDGKIVATLDGLANRSMHSTGMDEASIEECISLGDLARQRRELSSAGSTIRQEIASFESELQDIQFQLRTLGERITQLDEETESKLSEHQTSMLSLEQERSQVESRLCALSTRVTPVP